MQFDSSMYESLTGSLKTSICFLVSITDLMKENTELFVAVIDENSKHVIWFLLQQ